MGREHEVAHESALAREGRLELREVAVLVAGRIGAEVLGHLAEQEVPLERPARARHAGGGIDHHLAGLVDQPAPRERQECEQRRGGIAPGISHQVRRRDMRAGDLRQPVDRVGGQPEVGGQVHRAFTETAGRLHVARRYTVGQRRQHDLGPRERGVLDADELDAVAPLARRGLGRRERHRGPRMMGEQSQQLLTHVAGRPEHAHRHRCMNIHRYGKIFTLARSARAGLASHMITKLIPTLAALALAPALGAQAPTALSHSAPSQPFSLDDVLRVRDVREPEISPDGAWVAYTVSTSDTTEDQNKSAVWMASWDGTRNVRLTTSKPGESTPRWSPDGRWLAFLSSREDEHTQLWLLDRLGGEGRKATTQPRDVDDYVWAPDGKRVALVAEDPDTAKPKTPPPIVIDRFQFKQDEGGYLGKRRRHLYVLDVESGKTTMLTSGDYDELLPAWSPDGKALVFVSKRRPDFDRDSNWDLYVIDAGGGGAAPRQLTTFDGPDNDPDTESRPTWSPDGRSIAYLQGGPLKLIYYAVQKLAVVPAAGGAPRILTAALDRNVASPAWSGDGASITFLLEDDRTVGVARVPAAGGTIERIVSGPRVVSAFTAGEKGK